MRGRLALGTLVFLFAVAAVACGERSDVASGPPTVLLSGEVLSVNADASTIEVRGANDDRGTFLIADDTNLMNQDQKIRLVDLAPGSQVAVQAKRQGDTLVATYVEVLGD